jgi:hypothetical protein
MRKIQIKIAFSTKCNPSIYIVQLTELDFLVAKRRHLMPFRHGKLVTVV